MPGVVEWNRGPLGAKSGYPLHDPRAVIIQEDVAKVLQADGAAYEHALAIFGDIEGADHDAFEECCDRIAALHGGLNAAHLRAVAFARGGDGDDLLQVLADLDRLTLLERGIKATVGQWFDRWQGARA